MQLTMTSEQAYQRKDRTWKAFLAWKERVVRAFYPQTGGSEHLMHNWHRCNTKDKADAALADWIQDSTWERWNRIEKAMEDRRALREHLAHQGKFSPMWCPYCNAK